MDDMFWVAYAFNFNGKISSLNTSAVTDMSDMFWQAWSFNQDLSNWGDTSAVTTTRFMFDQASAFNGNVSSWNTSAVTDMSYIMFYGDGASSFNQEDLSKMGYSAVKTMKACSGEHQPLMSKSHIGTEHVISN
jgi:surface protein